MALTTDISMNKARLFISLLKKEGIDVSEAYLFGSGSKGLADEDSDIDIAVVSKDFQGLPYYDIKKVSKHRRKIDLRLEIHPFSFEEVETDPPSFFMKIKRDGLPIF